MSVSPTTLRMLTLAGEMDGFLPSAPARVDMASSMHDLRAVLNMERGYEPGELDACGYPTLDAIKARRTKRS